MIIFSIRPVKINLKTFFSRWAFPDDKRSNRQNLGFSVRHQDNEVVIYNSIVFR